MPKIFVPNSTRNDNKDIIENKLPQLSEEEQSILSKKDELKKASPSQQERPDWAAFIMLDGIN